MTVQVKYICQIPDVPGVDLIHPTKASAEHEAKNARKAGLTAEVIEVLMRIRGSVPVARAL